MDADLDLGFEARLKLLFVTFFGQGCLGGSGIHMNARIEGFPAEYFTEERSVICQGFHCCG